MKNFEKTNKKIWKYGKYFLSLLYKLITNNKIKVMRTLEQLKERKDELENELSQFMWWGNEDDADYKEEYGREYEHLQTELDGIREQIYQLKNK